jgi:hypothetical protein
MRERVAIAVAMLVVFMAALISYDVWRWNEGTRRLRARIEAARRPPAITRIDFRELAGLPAPVQRYFRTVLRQGRPIITAARVKHTGTFNMGAEDEQWKAFHSDQLVVTRRPGFDWDARITLFPGFVAHVHDAYVAGEGLLHASVFGFLTVADVQGPGEIATGELMRYVAEAPWYPTALLPSQGMRWEPVDERTARATLTDGPNVLTMTFRFTADGLVERVGTEARGRMVGEEIVPTPWEGRLWNYGLHEGMLVPFDGEVAWSLHEGRRPYWRGHITELNYEFAP